MLKTALKTLNKTCVICGDDITITILKDRISKGGYYFGKFPVHTEKQIKDALKAGWHNEKFGNHTISVLNKDPQAKEYAEYWECEGCYRDDNPTP